MGFQRMRTINRFHSTSCKHSLKLFVRECVAQGAKRSLIQHFVSHHKKAYSGTHNKTNFSNIGPLNAEIRHFEVRRN